jgi:predicted SPOUT superfamily RNA methylase MTH1
VEHSEAVEVEDIKRQRRPPTLSIAVAASVIDNVQSAELATLVAGQIARTAAIFNIDEVVVIDESPGPK